MAADEAAGIRIGVAVVDVEEGREAAEEEEGSCTVGCRPYFEYKLVAKQAKSSEEEQDCSERKEDPAGIGRSMVLMNATR